MQRQDVADDDPNGVSHPMGAAVVAGAETTIGTAIVRAFDERGWPVVGIVGPAADRSAVESAGCSMVLDEHPPDGIDDRFERVAARYGRIACLVTGPGSGRFDAVEDAGDVGLAESLDVNVRAPTRLIRAALPHMRYVEDGRIVVLTDVAARLSLPGWGTYSASMAGLAALTDAVRLEVADRGIEVVRIETRLLGHDAPREPVGSSRTGAYPELEQLAGDLAAVGGPLLRTTPATIASAVVDAASAGDPAGRRAVGTVARIIGVAALLPPRIRDPLIRLAVRVMT